MAKSMAPFEVWECVGMEVESDDKAKCGETYTHTHTLTYMAR